MELENTFGMIKSNMLVNGKIIKLMEKELWFGQMDKDILGNL